MPISDILVAPPTGIEAAGLITIEASAMGLPVIISDSGGMKEYLGSVGIVKLIDDKWSRFNYIKSAKKNINQHDINRFSDEFNCIIDEFIISFKGENFDE